MGNPAVFALDIFLLVTLIPFCAYGLYRILSIKNMPNYFRAIICCGVCSALTCILFDMFEYFPLNLSKSACAFTKFGLISTYNLSSAMLFLFYIVRLHILFAQTIYEVRQSVLYMLMVVWALNFIAGVIIAPSVLVGTSTIITKGGQTCGVKLSSIARSTLRPTQILSVFCQFSILVVLIRNLLSLSHYTTKTQVLTEEGDPFSDRVSRFIILFFVSVGATGLFYFGFLYTLKNPMIELDAAFNVLALLLNFRALDSFYAMLCFPCIKLFPKSCCVATWRTCCFCADEEPKLVECDSPVESQLSTHTTETSNNVFGDQHTHDRLSSGSTTQHA